MTITMMEDDEREPRKSKANQPDINGWSIEELEAYITHLKAEMVRAKAEIENKNSVRHAAEALFKKT